MKGQAASLLGSQAARFLLFGGLAAALNWGIRFPLSAFLPIGAAVVAAYVIGMSAGFYFYRTYVFPGSTHPIALQTAIFLAVNLVGAVVVLGLTYAFIALLAPLGYPPWAQEGLAHGLAIGFGAVVNFIGHKTLTFGLAAGGSLDHQHGV